MLHHNDFYLILSPVLGDPVGSIYLRLTALIDGESWPTSSAIIYVEIFDDNTCEYEFVHVYGPDYNLEYGWGSEPLEVSLDYIIEQAELNPACGEIPEVNLVFLDAFYNELPSSQTVLTFDYTDEILTVERCYHNRNDLDCLFGPDDEFYQIVFEVCVGSDCCEHCLPHMTVHITAAGDCGSNELEIYTVDQTYTIDAEAEYLSHATLLIYEPEII